MQINSKANAREEVLKKKGNSMPVSGFRKVSFHCSEWSYPFQMVLCYLISIIYSYQGTILISLHRSTRGDKVRAPEMVSTTCSTTIKRMVPAGQHFA